MSDNNSSNVFGKKNYLLMIASAAVLIIGFVIMSSDSKDGWGVGAMTVGPIIVAIGFVIPVFAILLRPKNEE